MESPNTACKGGVFENRASFLRHFRKFTGDLKLNTTRCWRKPECTIILETTSSWEPPAESISEFVHSQSPTLVIPTSSSRCQREINLNCFVQII